MFIDAASSSAKAPSAVPVPCDSSIVIDSGWTSATAIARTADEVLAHPSATRTQVAAGDVTTVRQLLPEIVDRARVLADCADLEPGGDRLHVARRRAMGPGHSCQG